MLYLYATLSTLTSHAGDALTDRVQQVRTNRDRGASTIETAVIYGILCAAAIALGAVVVRAITSHSASIK